MEAGAAFHQDPKDTMRGPDRHAVRDSSTPGEGWAIFAVSYLALAGLLNVIWGVTALTKSTYFRDGGLVVSSLDTWGWIAIVIAVAQIITAGLLLSRWMGGVVMAMVLAMVGVLLNFVTIGAYPVWSSIALVCNGLVLWAVTVHGDRFASDDD
jgi:hypothetical protein